MLRKEGCAVYSASDGYESITLVRAQNPDILLVDVNRHPNDAFGAAAPGMGFKLPDDFDMSALRTFLP